MSELYESPVLFPAEAAVRPWHERSLTVL